MKKMILILMLLLSWMFSANASSSIIISCTGLRKGSNAVYKVYDSMDKLVHTVVLEGKGAGVTVSRKIVGLNPGTYRVEDTKWAWAYDSPVRTISKTIEEGSVGTFDFKVSRRPDVGRALEDSAVNEFTTGGK